MIVERYKIRRSVKDLSRECGVSEVMIYKWVPCPAIADILHKEVMD